MAAKEIPCKILIFLSPFIALVCFLVIFGGIYYVVEQKCSNTFYCTSDAVIVNTSYIVDVGQCLSQKEIDKIKNNYSLTGSTSYWQSIHFIVTTVTTIGKN